LGEVVDGFNSPEDFIGHAGGDNFVIITKEANSASIRQQIKERFAEEVLAHYNFIDRQQGYILAPAESGQMVQTPMMTIAVGIVSPTTHVFSDIRQITELAGEERRQDIGLLSGRG